MKVCSICGDPLGVDGICDCQADHYQTKATIIERNFDDLINALHDEAAEERDEKIERKPINGTNLHSPGKLV